MENHAERMKALSQGLIEAQEAERRRVARELHDEIGQALTAVKIDIQAAQRIKDPQAIARHLEESIAIVERALAQVRNLSLDLRPSLLDDLGLVTALRWYVGRQAQRTGMAMQFTAESMDSRLSTELETACFRVAQEALTNVIRHAGAVSVGIELTKTPGCLTLVIRDNGKGFDVPAVREQAFLGKSLGLLGMQERVMIVGGDMQITSSPESGTEIRAVFPIPENK